MGRRKCVVNLQLLEHWREAEGREQMSAWLLRGEIATMSTNSRHIAGIRTAIAGGIMPLQHGHYHA